MKLTPFCLGLAVCVALVRSEDCHVIFDCVLETCRDDRYGLNCYHGTCTCNPIDYVVSDCATDFECAGIVHCQQGIPAKCIGYTANLKKCHCLSFPFAGK